MLQGDILVPPPSRILDGINHVSERSVKEARIARERGWDRFTRLACQTLRIRAGIRHRLILASADVSRLSAGLTMSSEAHATPDQTRGATSPPQRKTRPGSIGRIAA